MSRQTRALDLSGGGMRLALCSGVAVGLMAGLAPAPAVAQGTVEEIVVTARKREEALQDVPLAVTAYTSEQLDRSGITNPISLMGQVPSLTATSPSVGQTTAQFAIRGMQGSDSLLTIDQPIGLYIDGVNIPRPYGVNSSFFDLQRIEVLKGPQGTLYGRNTTGGAINILTRGADHQGLHGFLTAEAGNYSKWALRGAVNVPIMADKLALRLAAQHEERKGYGRSRITGQRFGGDRDIYNVRGSLLFTPVDSIRAEIKADWLQNHTNGVLRVPAIYVGGAATNTQIARELARGTATTPVTAAQLAAAQALGEQIAAMGRADIFTTDTELLQHEDVDVFRVGGTLSADLTEHVLLKSITGYHKLERDQIYDLDGTRFTILEINTRPDPAVATPFTFDPQPLTGAKFFSQEFNLSGDVFDGRVNWLGGVYYSRETGHDRNATVFRPLTSTSPLSVNFTDNRVKNTSWSIYSQNDIKLTERFKITLGARYTEERHFLDAISSRFNPGNGLFTCSFTTAADVSFADRYVRCSVPRDATFDGVSWLASANYDISDDVMVYLKAARGFKGGGWNLRVPTAPAFAPEYARDIELGVKGEYFDRRLRVNLAAYRTRYTNKQESIIIPLGLTPATVVQNAATATIKGVEGEVSAVPVEGLTLRGTFSYLLGRYDKFPGALDVLGRPVDASGEEFSNAGTGDPVKWAYSLSARYAFPLAGGVAGLQADWTWRDKHNLAARLTDPSLTPALVDKYYGEVGLLNLRADYELADNLLIAVFATNALNKHYQRVTLPSVSTGNVQYAATMEPRMVGVQIKKSFGAGE